MSSVIKKIGNQGNFNLWGTRNAITLPDGSCAVVFIDTNSSSAPSTWGDQSNVSRVCVYHSTDRQGWTLRYQVAIPSGTGGSRVTANVAPDGRLGIAIFDGNDKTIRYTAINTSTWGVVTAWETVHTALSATRIQRDVDLSFTDTNVPVIGALRADTTGSFRLQVALFTRRTSDNTWVGDTLNTLFSTTTPKSSYQSFSSLVLEGGSPTARNVVFVAAYGANNSDGGGKLFTCVLNETTGGSTDGVQKDTYGMGQVPSNSVADASRNVMLFNAGLNEYVVGVQHYEGGRQAGFARGRWDGTTWTRIQAYTTVNVTHPIIQYNMAMTYSSDKLAFHYAVHAGQIVTYLATHDQEAGKVIFAPACWFDNNSRNPSLCILGGTGPFVEYPNHDLLFVFRPNATQQSMMHHYAKPAPAPTGVVPAGGTVTNSSTPAMQAKVDLDVQYAQARVKVRWEIASNSSFTNDLRVFEQEDSSFTYVGNTHLAGAFVLFAQFLDSDFALEQGNWFVRSAVVSEFDVIGLYSAAQQFSVSHPPSAADIMPNNKSLPWAANVAVTWRFTDPSSTDSQSAYQVQVENRSSGALVFDSGKVYSKFGSGVISVPIANKNIPLRMRIRLTDSDDVTGSWSGYVYFTLGDAPVVNILSPIAGTPVTTTTPTIISEVTFAGNRTVAAGKIIVKQGSVKKYESPIQPLALTSGSTWSFVLPSTILDNLQTYTIESYAADQGGLWSVAGTRVITTEWVRPPSTAGLALDTTAYNTENAGYVGVMWNDSTRDPDFSFWQVKRRVDYIDPNTGVVLKPGIWVNIARVSNVSPNYTYRDYTAPAAHKIYYSVEQVVIRFGDVVSSNTTTPVSAIPLSDSYWLLQPDTQEAFQLGSVTEDEYTDEYEEETFLVIGRGRHVDVGERLGYQGSLTAQVRDRPTMSARQRKMRLEDIKKQNRRLFLRTPFGDLFRVSVSSMQYSRIAGTGVSEFFDVTIPYAEVGE